MISGLYLKQKYAELSMEKKTLQTEKGRIVYWTSGPDRSGKR